MSKCQPPWVAPLFNLDRDMSTRVLTNPSNDTQQAVTYLINTLRPESNDQQFNSLQIFKDIFMNEYWVLYIDISQKIVYMDPIGKKSVLVHILASDKQATSHYLKQ